MARIRDAENTQSVAELTQKISSLEYKNQEMLTEGDLVTSMNQSDKVRELQDKIASLRAQVTRLSLLNAKLSKSLSMHNLAASFSSGTSESSSPNGGTPSGIGARSRSPSQSSLKLNLSAALSASSAVSSDCNPLDGALSFLSQPQHPDHQLTPTPTRTRSVTNILTPTNLNPSTSPPT